MDFFAQLPLAPPDPILSLTRLFQLDTRPTKVNLGVGTYLTEDLQPLILRSVKEAEKKILLNEKSKDYLPIEGDARYLELSYDLLFDQPLPETVAAVQTVGGTNGLRIAAEALKNVGFTKIALPIPTWGNHRQIFTHAGLEVVDIPYYNGEEGSLDFENYCQALQTAPSATIILLHGCCHNPTGIDPTDSQWKKILRIIQERGHFPLFDIAYQGFGSSLSEDAAALRLFKASGIELAVAVSFSKNFGLYAERTGVLFFSTHYQSHKEALLSQLKILIRGNYSNPPLHGARIVTEILQDPLLKSLWTGEVNAMRGRIEAMRVLLASSLEARFPEGKSPFQHLTKSRGMFAFSGLQEGQVAKLQSDYGIYLLKNGRINLAGVTTENVGYITDVILEV